MLAFFKKLSLESGSEVSQVVPGSPGSPVIHGSSIATVASTPSGSISQLGYRDNNDLKETIYGSLCFLSVRILIRHYITRIIFQISCERLEIRKSQLLSRI